MLIDYFNGGACAPSLSIVAQIEIREEASLVFIDLWFGIILGCLQKNTRLCHGRRKSLNTSKRLYFVIVKDISCISTMYDLLLKIYVLLIAKKLYAS
jgi:hypothetical protein